MRTCLHRLKYLLDERAWNLGMEKVLIELTKIVFAQDATSLVARQRPCAMLAEIRRRSVDYPWHVDGSRLAFRNRGQPS